MLIIKVKKGNITRALKEYKSKVIKTRQIKKLREQEQFEKPSEKKRKVLQKAKYKENKFRKD